MTDLIAELAEVVRLREAWAESNDEASWNELALHAVNFAAHHATLTRILTDDAAIRAAHHDLVIRLGEVTTRLEAANALLRTIRGCINETRGAYAGDVVREIDAHLSEPRT